MKFANPNTEGMRPRSTPTEGRLEVRSIFPPALSFGAALAAWAGLAQSLMPQ